MLKRFKAAAGVLLNGVGNSVGIRKAFADGHFYSPTVNIAEVQQDQQRIWPVAEDPAGIDFNWAEHQRWLTTILPRHLPDYDYPDEATEGADEAAFYTRNSQFSWLDSRTLFAVLREFRPRRMIEIGSGFSSLLAANVNRRFLGGQLDLTCIEPFPRPFLRRGIAGISRLVEARVQDVPLETFTALEQGDVLFIDSSHVAKTGSDVNFIYFEVLPRLRPGVLVHIHDIFLPNDYPKEWVIDLGIHWNEQYLVRALLTDSHGFEVLFGCAYALERFPEQLRLLLGGSLFGGGSLWLRRSGEQR
jgi:predicted O-methyltransferase YrrM